MSISFHPVGAAVENTISLCFSNTMIIRSCDIVRIGLFVHFIKRECEVSGAWGELFGDKLSL